MKVQCDVCGNEEAAVFCCADEAALCEPCDRRVHRANKLAGKHRRFSLLPPSSSSHPVCDICQERRGFVFCQEDRAILCRDCDVPIHSANHLTKKHNRFLITGLRLSSAPLSSSSSSSPEAEMAVADNNDHSNKGVPERNQDKALPVDDSVLCGSDSSIITSTFTAAATAAPAASNSSTGGGSSISDYLIKMCPGWRVEDLLVDDAAAAFAVDGFSKTMMDEMLPFMETDLEGAGLEAVAEEFPIWVPHVPQIPAVPGSAAATAGVHYQPWVPAKDLNSTHLHHGAKAAGRERWSDDAFTVPQIAPTSPNPVKRPRQQSLWYF